MEVCVFFFLAVIVSTLGQQPFYRHSWKRFDDDNGPTHEGGGPSPNPDLNENRPTSQPGSNSKESRRRCKEEKKCNLAFFKTILQEFRAFPSGGSTDMTGYDPITYDPLLDEFWGEKEDDGLDTALVNLGGKFVRRLLQDRYKCRATQFNQVLISILENRTDSFIAEKTTEFMSNITDILQQIPNIDQARLTELPNEIIKMINRTMHNTIITYLEDEEFKDVSCFMKDVEERLREGIETGETLEDVKDDVQEYATEYLDIFTCTRPSRVLEIYREGWNLLTMPRGERNIMVHIKHELKNILANEDDRGARKGIVRMLVKFVHRFIVNVVKPLKPVIDIRTKQGMLDFLRMRLPTEKFAFAEQLVESIWNSLGYMTPPPTVSPVWTNEPPASPNSKLSRHIYDRNKPNTQPEVNPTKPPTASKPKTKPPPTAQPRSKPPTTGQPRAQTPPTVHPNEEKETTESPSVANNLYQRMMHLEKMRRRYLQMMQRRRNLERMQDYENMNSQW